MVCFRTIRRRGFGKTIMDKLNLIGSDSGGMYMFDRDMENSLIQANNVDNSTEN